MVGAEQGLQAPDAVNVLRRRNLYPRGRWGKQVKRVPIRPVKNC